MFRLDFILFIFTFISVTEGYECDQNDMTRCMEPIYELRHILGISDELKYFPIYKLNSTQLDSYCLIGTNAASCLNNLKGCTSVVRNIFKGMQDSFDFLCKETLDEYKSYKQCFARVSSIFPALERCDKETSQHLLAHRSDIIHGAKSEICSIVKDDFNCQRRAIEPHCRSEAANWQVMYTKSILKPTLQQIDCKIKVAVTRKPSATHNRIIPPHAAADTAENKDLDVYMPCDTNSVKECMKPITDLRHQLGISDDLKYFPVYKLNAEQLDKYCLDGEKADSCLKKLSDCPTIESRLFQGVSDAFDYLCSKTLDEYKRHQSCFAKSVVVNGLEECDKQASEAVTKYETKEHLCQIVKSDYSCIKNAVEGECGKEAADWEVTYVKKILTPMLNEVGCTGMPLWAIGTIAVVGIIALVVIMKCCTMACAKRRRNAQSQANRANHFHNVLATTSEKPPVYEYEGKGV